MRAPTTTPWQRRDRRLNFFYRDVTDKIELDGVPDGVNDIFQEFINEDIEATSS